MENQHVVDLGATQAPEVVIDNPNTKRGWVLDALVKIGQIEAALNHNDEQISYLKDQLSKTDDPTEVTKLIDEIAVNEQLMEIDYQNRKDSMDELFDTLSGDRHYYCQVKHRAASFITAAEIFHSRGCNPKDEESMHRAAEALALTCSLAFGFKPFSCLRCMDNATQEKEQSDLM